jgi:hypothetical protein
VAIPVILNIIRRENVATARPNDPVKSDHGLQMPCRACSFICIARAHRQGDEKITDLAKISTKRLPGCRRGWRVQQPSNAA